MKKRVFQRMVNSVFEVLVDTEDWSQDDIRLMVEYGEPEVDMGGSVSYTWQDELKGVSFGSEFVRVLHGMPYLRKFDSRDYDSAGEAKAIGSAWKDAVLAKIDEAVLATRAKGVSFPTEEVSEL